MTEDLDRAKEVATTRLREEIKPAHVSLVSDFTRGIKPPGFDPAVLFLTMWQREFNGTVSWPGTVSAGPSGSRSFITEGIDPAPGTPLNSHGVVHFDGSKELFTSNTTAQYVVQTAGTVFVLFNAASAPADGGTGVNPGLWADTAGGLNVSLTASGWTVYFQGAGIAVPASISSWVLGQAKWDGVNISARINSGSWSQVAYTPGGIDTAPDRIGASFAGATHYNGEFAEIITSNQTFSDGTCDAILSYFNLRYGLTL